MRLTGCWVRLVSVSCFFSEIEKNTNGIQFFNIPFLFQAKEELRKCHCQERWAQVGRGIHPIVFRTQCCKCYIDLTEESPGQFDLENGAELDVEKGHAKTLATLRMGVVSKYSLILCPALGLQYPASPPPSRGDRATDKNGVNVDP